MPQRQGEGGGVRVWCALESLFPLSILNVHKWGVKTPSPSTTNENEMQLRGICVHFHQLECPTGLCHRQNCCSQWHRLRVGRGGGVRRPPPPPSRDLLLPLPPERTNAFSSVSTHLPWAVAPNGSAGLHRLRPPFATHPGGPTYAQLSTLSSANPLQSRLLRPPPLSSCGQTTPGCRVHSVRHPIAHWHPGFCRPSKCKSDSPIGGGRMVVAARCSRPLHGGWIEPSHRGSGAPATRKAWILMRDARWSGRAWPCGAIPTSDVVEGTVQATQSWNDCM